MSRFRRRQHTPVRREVVVRVQQVPMRVYGMLASNLWKELRDSHVRSYREGARNAARRDLQGMGLLEFDLPTKNFVLTDAGRKALRTGKAA